MLIELYHKQNALLWNFKGFRLMEKLSKIKDAQCCFSETSFELVF